MKKGIIMEIEEEFLTLITPEGEFLHTRRQNQPYAIGEEIHFFPMERVKSSNPFSWFNSIFKFKPVWALVAVFVIMLGSFIPMYQSNKAYAYMSIDVNPSIELGVNKKMQVVEIKGINKDGKKIVSHLTNWKKKNVSKLAQTILAEMNKEGYLGKNDQVIISTVRTKNPEVKAEKELKENIEEIKASLEKQKVKILVDNSSKKESKKVHKPVSSDTETKTVTKETSEVKTKNKKKQTDSKAVQKKPDDPIPYEPIKKQKENKAVKNKGAAEIKRPIEKKWVNGKFISSGHWKKFEENKSKQNQGLINNQNNQKEKKSDSKKTLNQEDRKGKDRDKNTVKSKNWKNRDGNTVKNNNGKDSYENTAKSKGKDTKNNNNKNSKKSSGNNSSAKGINKVRK